MLSPRIAILDGIRTPFCKAGGPLKDVGADDLGTIVVKELLARTGLGPQQIDEVIFGNVAQPAHAANIARVIALKAGLPEGMVCHTVHHNCASGMRSLTAAALHIRTGQAEVVIAGGTESMSQIPLLFGPQMTKLFIRLLRARTLGGRLKAIASFRPSFLRPVIGLQLGLTDPICGLNMGETAEVLAREFGVTRQEQDAFSLLSHQRAVAAAAQDRLAPEIVPVVAAPEYRHAQTTDDGARPDQSIEALGRLKPYFDRQAGTVTVGNTCPVTDGAAALLVASEEKARELGIEPLGFMSGWAYAGLDGRRMGLGPVYATAKLLEQTGMKLAELDLIELNEAFAAQVIANERAFSSASFAREHLGRDEALGELDRDRLNVNGGAIAVGHPVGATGTRLVLTLLHALRQREKQRGLATLCVGGGQGAAVALEAA
ncbi:MAG: thiolase family protein [Planctomycetota bacterium]|jgi:acetyl-CoA C-acetyltransferase/acetyl-CoA acyltransferase